MYIESFPCRGATSAPAAPANLNEPPATPANLLPTWLALSAAVRSGSAIEGEKLNAVCELVQCLQSRILAIPATSAADLSAKLTVWRAVIDDTACIIEGHPALWAGLERFVVAHIEMAEASR